VDPVPHPCKKQRAKIEDAETISSMSLILPVLWNRNRNRNRRNRNFLTSGTGTVINYGSGTGTRYKIMYLITFIKKFFHSHFTINLLKFLYFFLLKQLTTVCKKAKKFPQFFLEKFAFYGLDMELEPEPEPELF
jgi:hypothetical protein